MASSGVTYTNSPIRSVNFAELTPSRFLLQKERELPYRDASGAVSLPLVECSLAEARERNLGDALISRLAAWQRHASRSLLTSSSGGGGTATPDSSASARAAATPPRRFSHALPADLQENNEEEEGPPSKRLRSTEPVTPQRPPTSVVTPPRPLATAKRMSSADCPKSPVARRRSSMTPLSPLQSFCQSVLNAESSDSDVYEVERVVKEGESGNFLIRWAGYDERHDTWEPEANINPALIAAFKRELAEAESYEGRDYVRPETSQRRLWCRVCKTHRHPDNFSQHMRAADETRRICLMHHGETSITTTPPRRASPATLTAAQLARCRKFGLSSW